MQKIASSVEKALMLALLALFYAPLLLALFFYDLGDRVLPWTNWLTNSTLVGRQAPEPVSLPAVSLAGIWSGDYQRKTADLFNRNFYGRELVIRMIDELYFRLFRVCSIPSANVVVGNGDILCEIDYLQEYCLLRRNKEDLLPFVRNLKHLQDVCRARGMGFAVMITPSKAAILPEMIPDRWKLVHDSRPRAYELFTSLLREEGVRFVDGHALTEQAKSESQIPVFPKGGNHWGHYASFQTTNALLAELQNQGKPVHPIEHFHLQVSNDPIYDEADLLNLMNLAFPWKYPVEHVEVTPTESETSSRGNLVMIGGSFMWRVAEFLNKSRQFSEIDCYYYYHLHKRCYADDTETVVAEPTRTVDFAREIFAADNLVLEINEAVIPAEESHLTVFTDDALDHLPDGPASREPFRYESFLSYVPGEEISFQDPDPARDVKSIYLRGFSGASTEGSHASVRLQIPPLDCDGVLQAQLQLESSGAAPDREVSVAVNGTPIGKWTIASSAPIKRQILIPKALLALGGKVVLTFSTSLSENTPASMPPKLGLVFHSLCLYRINGTPTPK